jgi:antitoxin (DNA-binding transcriptional repressor) of toxin-antitoxin stability system
LATDFSPIHTPEANSWQRKDTSELVAWEFDKARPWTQNVHMRIATVRDLRNNFSKLEAWLGNGEEVCIQKRGEPVAMLTAMRDNRLEKGKNPDFAARRNAIWGGRVFSDAEVRAMRDAELEGEEG